MPDACRSAFVTDSRWLVSRAVFDRLALTGHRHDAADDACQVRVATQGAPPRRFGCRPRRLLIEINQRLTGTFLAIQGDAHRFLPVNRVVRVVQWDRLESPLADDLDAVGRVSVHDPRVAAIVASVVVRASALGRLIAEASRWGRAFRTRTNGHLHTLGGSVKFL